MKEIILTTRGERVEVNAQTEEAVEFVDAYVGPMLETIDAGRIVIPLDSVEDAHGFTWLAANAGLGCEEGEV